MSLAFANYPRLEIPEGRVKKIARKSDGLVLWTAGYINMVPLSTTEDGVTIYNGTGYKDGYRIRSGGTETALDASSITGFIPVNGGDVVRISGCNFGDGSANGSALNVSDSSFTNIGQFSMIQAQYGIFASSYSAYSYASVVEETTGVWKWIVPPTAAGVAYIRVTARTSGDGSGMIVTVNEEITL